ncbi:MAG: LPS export ABC transporter permease LptG [Xanthomonadales bacterium]|nr:Lipopolysaccharide export system permease protein LptG [Xanthomonadales bacterium]MCC6594097.1 LPS export ABC transporter permease LptG [Xanthomonadales bacterium]MCE7930179.1 LPS export ABC transporter permease LptG [Xanthomonadales bacterium PRO6]
MNRLDLLVLKAVVPAVLLAWVVFVGFDTLLALLNEFDEVGIGEYDLIRVLEYIALTVPRRMYAMFSTAAVVGSMLGLGGLAARSELVALQAAGASRLRIGIAAVQAVAPLLVAALLLGEWIGPRADRMAADLSAQSKSQGIAFSGSGLWLRDGHAVWNARRIVVGGPGQVDLWEVWRYQFGEDARVQEVLKAERARYTGGSFELSGIVRDRLSDEQVHSSQETTASVPTLLDPGLIESHTVRPRQQATRDLYETMRYARINQLDALAFESAFWYRVFYPFVALALTFAAAPFAFGNLRSGGLGQRLLLGMALGIGFFFGQRTLINLAETNREGLILVNVVPPLLLVAITTWALRRPAR